jgi:hypothetical protein
MKAFVAVIGYATMLATLSAETATEVWKWGTLPASFAWLAGGAISFVPIVRTIFFALILCQVMPWWLAIPTSGVVSFIRWWLFYYDVRKANIGETRARILGAVQEAKHPRCGSGEESSL